MPRITKPSERRRLIKSEPDLWSLDIQRKYLRPLIDSISINHQAFSSNQYNYDARKSLFDIIEDLSLSTLFLTRIIFAFICPFNKLHLFNINTNVNVYLIY